MGTLKAAQPFWTALLLAVLCTWLLQTSMCLFFTARTDVARMGFAFYGPFAFVIGGTQHVIANVGFLGLPLLLTAFHTRCHTAGSAGASAATISSRTCAPPASATSSAAPFLLPFPFNSSRGCYSDRADLRPAVSRRSVAS